MFADIGGENPGGLLARVAADSGHRRFFYEFNVPPRLGSDRASVVVGIAAPFEAVFADLIPFLAGDFACLAAYA
jgi:hypothetical protein